MDASPDHVDEADVGALLGPITLVNEGEHLRSFERKPDFDAVLSAACDISLAN